MRLKRSVLIVGLVALLGSACAGDEGGGGASAVEGDEGQGGGGGATLVASNFAFEPSSLTVATGDTIRFTNEDDAKHNITVEQADIDEDVDPSASTTVSLEGVETGEYEFFCEYHPDAMTGTLEVTG